LLTKSINTTLILAKFYLRLIYSLFLWL